MLGQRAFELRHLRVELARFFALRAQRQDPEGGCHRRDQQHRADHEVRLLLGLDLHQPSDPSSELSLDAASVDVVVLTSSSPSAAGTGAASKPTTSSNWAMNPRVRQSPPPPPPLPGLAFLAGEFGGAEADAGDAVDVFERGDEFGDRFLAAGAAAQFERRAGDSATQPRPAASPFASDRRARSRRGAEARQPDVAGQHERQFAHHPFPVEAAVGEAPHGGDPLFAQSAELGVGGELLRFAPRPRRLRCFSVATSALLSAIWLPVRTSSGDAEQDESKRAEDDVGERPGAQRGLVAAALLGGDQVDGAHRSALQREAVGQGQARRGGIVEALERRPAAKRRSAAPRRSSI